MAAYFLDASARKAVPNLATLLSDHHFSAHCQVQAPILLSNVDRLSVNNRRV